jgi:hypothetical protein
MSRRIGSGVGFNFLPFYNRSNSHSISYTQARYVYNTLSDPRQRITQYLNERTIKVRRFRPNVCGSRGKR